MNRNGPVMVIEDDPDEQELLRDVFETLKYENKLMFFNKGVAALEFLNTSDIIYHSLRY